MSDRAARTAGGAHVEHSPSTLQQPLELHWRAVQVPHGVFDKLLSVRVQRCLIVTHGQASQPL